jgi:glycosyltransferase involved in cell wall biosynthesis
MKSNRLPKPARIAEQVWPEGTEPLLSIWCISYNHENFIRDAIEGFLFQQTDFPVEIFVHDDASTDGTAEIIQKYAAKYPKLFWTVLQKENQCSKGNSIILYKYMAFQRGKFIALCEGDDYWTDELKLTKQVEFLERNPGYSGVFHRGYAVDEVKNRIGFAWDKLKYKDKYSQKECIFELLSGYPTAGLVLRKSALPQPPKDFPSYFLKRTCDYFLDILITNSGFLGFIDFEGSAYRQHPGGFWSTLNRIQTHKHKVDRFSILFQCKEMAKRYPELKCKLLHLMDVQWRYYLKSDDGKWTSATLRNILEQRSSGLLLILQWIFRVESPVRYELKDILLRSNLKQKKQKKFLKYLISLNFKILILMWKCILKSFAYLLSKRNRINE